MRSHFRPEPPFARMDRAHADLQQLSELLGRRGPLVIRKTNQVPPQVSIIDVVAAITGQDANVAAMVFRRTKERYPELDALCADFKFPGRRQQKNSCAISLTPGARQKNTCATHSGGVRSETKRNGLITNPWLAP